MVESAPFRKINIMRSAIDLTIKVPADLDSLETLLVERGIALRDNESPDTECVFLLSFHHDGVVWGRLSEDDKLRTSDALAPQASANEMRSPSPKFRVETLQECRLFSERGELLIWRVNGKEFKARQILDYGNDEIARSEDAAEKECFDEPHVLWGREIDKDFDSADADFTVVREGQGVRHAFPMRVPPSVFKSHESEDGGGGATETKRRRPLRLYTRHYVDYDDDGCARIALSRLVRVEVQSAEV